MEARSPHYSGIPSFQSAANILIWNSDTIEAALIENTLQFAGYSNTHCAKTYQEGLEYLQNESVDVFLIDMKLGSVDCLHLIKALRDSFAYRYTPVLITVQSHTVEDTLNAMKAGANDLVNKPLSAHHLSQKIELHLKAASMA